MSYILRKHQNVKKLTITSISRFQSLRNFTEGKADYDVAVIGAGPGGYVAAIKAAQLGLKSVCIEKREKLGGTCLNVGCIPSKALLNASHHYHNAKHNLGKFGISVSDCKIDIAKMQAAKSKSVKSLTGGIEMLFRKNNVSWLKGSAKLKSETEIQVTSPTGEQKSVFAKNIILATGSASKSLPGLNIDEKMILSSTGALELTFVPKNLAVVGAGVIGLEMGSIWSRLGSNVTVIEFLDRIAPGLDNEVAADFTKLLKKQGLAFKFQTSVKSAKVTSGGVDLTIEGQRDKKLENLSFDKVLVAVGRKPYFDGLNIDNLGLKTEHGMITTDMALKTNIPNIFAIGDVTKGAQLAHKAEEEGIAVVEMIAGKVAHLNYDAIPSVIYTSPEVAAVGKTEEQLKKEKVEYKKGKFPFLANSRAKTVDDFEGFVKVLSEKNSDRLLGVHIIGEQAGDLIQEAVLALNYGGSAEDIARTCHAHPTRSEALKEAAMAACDKAIHF